MDKIEIAEKFAKMWRKSRADAGKSQDYVAKALGVSKQTIQNWESGLGCPNQMKGFEWFKVLGVAPLPYYLDILYPEHAGNCENEEEIEKALIDYIKGCGIDQKRNLLYLFKGNHGSSVASVLELITAHLHTTLRNRIVIASTVLTNYELAEALGELVEPDKCLPNIELLRKSIFSSVDAVKHREASYVALSEGKE